MTIPTPDPATRLREIRDDVEVSDYEASKAYYAPELLDIGDGLLAEVRRLEGENGRLREALTFYANEDRYEYDPTCCPDGYNPGKQTYGEDVLADNGNRARAALAGGGEG